MTEALFSAIRECPKQKMLSILHYTKKIVSLHRKKLVNKHYEKPVYHCSLRI